jgi:AcrR family transcriptional regulator
MTTSTEAATDGRIQRSERSREAIVTALVDLVGEGFPEPTAQQVAERADVGVRTVFRHFSDMDTLFAAMNDRLMEKANVYFIDEDQVGPVSKRIDSLIDRRSRLFALIEPYQRAQAIQRSRSPFLQQQHERTTKILRMDLKRWLPEISTADSETADALELTLSYECWGRLRFDQGLGARRAQAVMRRLVLAVIADSSL